jgi:hypothetical protein
MDFFTLGYKQLSEKKKKNSLRVTGGQRNKEVVQVKKEVKMKTFQTNQLVLKK